MTDASSMSSLFSQAALLMLVGMLFVFLFLALLNACIRFIIAPIGQYLPDRSNQSTNQGSNHSSNTSSNDIPPEVIAAISAAIKQHRQKH